MFCPNCGAQNREDATFCEACGSRLEEDFPMDGQPEGIQPGEMPPSWMPPGSIQPGEMPPGGGYAGHAQRKPVSRFAVFLAAEVLALALLAYGVYTTAKTLSSAEKTAEAYFVHMANGEWEQAYQMLDLEEDALLSEEMFALANSQGRDPVKDYRVGQAEGTGLGGQESFLGENGAESEPDMTVPVEYRLEDGDSRTQEILLSRGSGKQYFFFDDWKVGTQDLICKDYSIFVPEGADVSVDGIALTDDKGKAKQEGYSYAQKTVGGAAGDGMEEYVVPRIFYGPHEIKVSMEDMEDIKRRVTVDGAGLPFYVDTMYLKQETMEMLTEKVGENMEKVYQAVISKKDFQEIRQLFTSEPGNLTGIQERYEYFLELIHERGVLPKKIYCYDIQTSMENDRAEVYLTFGFELQYTYEGQSDKDNSHIETCVYFTKENGTWVQENLAYD